MIRRIISAERELEACREARPSIRRHFGAGAVLNVLQWVNPEIARFTVEGEGCEVWCCPQAIFYEDTEAPVMA